MIGEIISIGTELLLGQIVNTNASYLANKLAQLGIDTYYQTTVGDNKNRLLNSLKIAAERSDLIILTGGLGPTEDDLTKETVAEYLGIPLEKSAQELLKIKHYFKDRGLEWIDTNAKQADIISGSEILANEIGTAPGVALEHSNKLYVLLPGPPLEMKTMFENQVIPWLKNKTFKSEGHLYSHVLKFVGVTESKLEYLLMDLFQKQSQPTLALLAKPQEIQLRVTAKAKDWETFCKLISPFVKEIKQRAGEYLFAVDEERAEDIIAEYLTAFNLTVGTAESCTGGMLSSALTALPGSSQYYLGSIISYHNKIKAGILGVPEGLLKEYGAVSEQVGRSMAERARKLMGSDIGVGITGIAGPGGGSCEKPVGLVYIALNARETSWCQRYYFSGDRENVRQQTVVAAQLLLLKYLRSVNH